VTAEQRLKNAIERHTHLILNLKQRHLESHDSAEKRSITRCIKQERLFREALEYALNFVQGEVIDDPHSD